MTAPLPRPASAISRLDRYRSEHLKSIGRRWLGKGAVNYRRDQLLTLLPPLLDDPERIRQIAADLNPIECALLGALSFSGGRAPQEALAVTLRLCGVPIPGDEQDGQVDPVDRLVFQMIQAGLLFSEGTISVDFYYDRAAQIVSADRRLLALVPPLPIWTLSLPLLDPASVSAGARRRPQAVMSDVAAVVELVREQGRGALQLTQTRALRQGTRTQVLRALCWHRALPPDVAALNEPADFLLGVLCAAGLLNRDSKAITVTEEADELLCGPIEVLGARLLRGYLGLLDWAERPATGYSGGFERYAARHPAARRLLIEGLRALPDAGRSFVSMAALSAALGQRVCHRFRLGPRRPFSPPVGIRGPEAAACRRRWVEDQRISWENEERPWIEAALSGPLRALGFVELSTGPGGTPLVRLTELGRAVLLPGSEAPLRPAGGPVFQVLPTFEVLVYLDSATPRQLHFIERHAERAAAQEHLRTYQLTPDAFYRALRRGEKAQEVLEELSRGSGRPVPQNVQAEVMDWAARGEQVALHAGIQLLEFADEAARDAALSGRAGRPIGDRFLLLAPGGDGDADADAEGDAGLAQAAVLDYAAPPQRCLVLAEDGGVELLPTADLLVEAQLQRLAERVGGRRYRLSAARVAQAARALGAEEPLSFLTARALDGVPPLLRLAVRGMTGAQRALSLGTAVVLQCPDPEAARALLESVVLRPYLRGQLAPDVLVLDPDPEAVARVRGLLEGLGVPLQLTETR
jgi:hypothetical protein